MMKVERQRCFWMTFPSLSLLPSKINFTREILQFLFDRETDYIIIITFNNTAMGCNVSTEERPDTLVEDFQERPMNVKKPQKVDDGNNHYLKVKVNPNEYYGGSASKEEMEDLERRISSASARYRKIQSPAVSVAEESWFSKLFQRGAKK